MQIVLSLSWLVHLCTALTGSALRRGNTLTLDLDLCPFLQVWRWWRCWSPSWWPSCWTRAPWPAPAPAAAPWTTRPSTSSCAWASSTPGTSSRSWAPLPTCDRAWPRPSSSTRSRRNRPRLARRPRRCPSPRSPPSSWPWTSARSSARRGALYLSLCRGTRKVAGRKVRWLGSSLSPGSEAWLLYEFSCTGWKLLLVLV